MNNYLSDLYSQNEDTILLKLKFNLIDNCAIYDESIYDEPNYDDKILYQYNKSDREMVGISSYCYENRSLFKMLKFLTKKERNNTNIAKLALIDTSLFIKDNKLNNFKKLNKYLSVYIHSQDIISLIFKYYFNLIFYKLKSQKQFFLNVDFNLIRIKIYNNKLLMELIKKNFPKIFYNFKTMNFYSKFILLPEKFMSLYHDKFNSKLISKHQNLSLNFIKNNINIIDFTLLSENLYLNDDIINIYYKQLNWDYISQYYNLSHKNIIKYIKLINLNKLFKNKILIKYS